MGKRTGLLFLSLLIILALSVGFPSVAHSEILLEWQEGPLKGGTISESDGILTMSGGNGHDIPPCLYRDFRPASDFEVTFDLKAETLGEVILDQAGEGFVFSFGDMNLTSQEDHVAGFWCRARAGGQFLLAWHDALCDQYGWQCNWEPFVYNGLGYNNGYDFWHPNLPQDRSNAPVQPDVWYSISLRVEATPFTMVCDIYRDSKLLGSLSVDEINDFTFADINHLYMSTGAGGTFYLRNMVISGTENNCETFSDWHAGYQGGMFAVSDGVLKLSGDERAAGPCLYREFTPDDDFEISFQLKAATLGEVDRDPNGAGEGFMLFLWPSTNFGTPTGVAFEMRGRGGGQFLLDRRTNAWAWDWTPFIYNTLGYNNGYSFWHSSDRNLTDNARVKPNVWYTVNIEVQKNPFTVTATVMNEDGTKLGSFSISDMVDFSFNDIKFLAISSGFGGDFYVRNFRITRVEQNVSPTMLTISAEPSVVIGSPVNIQGHLISNGVALADELIVLRYTFPGADEWYPIGSATTNLNGEFQIQWLNTATGTFTLGAEWKGNDYLPSASANMTLNSMPIQNSIFYIESNSTVTFLAFNTSLSELSFNVSGPSGTSGYVKATVAKSLLPNGADARLYLDGRQLNYELQETPDCWLLTFGYQHSTHRVSLNLPLAQASRATVDGDNSVYILVVIGATFLVLVLGIFLQKKKSSHIHGTEKAPPS